MDTPIPASEIETRIREEAERKIAAVHTLKDVHKEIIEEREVFLTQDSERRRRLGEAIALAKKAGFSDLEVNDWRVEPIGVTRPKTKSRRGHSKRRSGASEPGTAVSNSAISDPSGSGVESDGHTAGTAA